MKVILTTLFFISFFYVSVAQKDPVVLTVNDKTVKKSDFLQVYLKNNNDPKFDKESLDSYMELYKKFKLKVAEAEELGYDTLPNLKNELEGYRKQLARPYMVDSAKNKALVKEAYERSKYEIDASHILVRVDENASAEDTLKAYKKIVQLKKRIENGEDFAEVAAGKNGSEDPSAVDNKGRLGYFTAFQMVYPFESVAYNTPLGEVGGPVRTKYGYHLVKVHDKRAARGTLTTAHIMVAVRKDADKYALEKAELKINEIYERLENGEDFDKLAKMFSDDQATKQKGGKLPSFGSGTNQRMISEYEDAAFSLKNDGDYTGPIRTDYGYHIIKRLDYSPLGTFEELENSLKTKVNKGLRGQRSQVSFIASLKKENKFKDKSEKGLAWFDENVDEKIFRGKWEAPEISKDRWLFKYDGEKYTTEDFRTYLLKNQKSAKKIDISIHIRKMYNDWQNEVIIANEESKLDQKYPEFRALINEYHDGVLLYEIMKDKVWDKAMKDTTGLKAFYQKNINNYKWDERVDAEVFEAKDKDVAEQTYKFLKENDTLTTEEVITLVNEDSQLNLSLKKDKFIKSENKFLNHIDLKEGINEIFEFDDIYYIVIVKEFYPKMNKTLKEARGQVIQDYQNHLEETWLNELSDKHIITIQNEVLYSLEK